MIILLRTLTSIHTGYLLILCLKPALAVFPLYVVGNSILSGEHIFLSHSKCGMPPKSFWLCLQNQSIIWSFLSTSIATTLVGKSIISYLDSFSQLISLLLSLALFTICMHTAGRVTQNIYDLFCLQFSHDFPIQKAELIVVACKIPENILPHAWPLWPLILLLSPGFFLFVLIGLIPIHGTFTYVLPQVIFSCWSFCPECSPQIST